MRRWCCLVGIGLALISHAQESSGPAAIRPQAIIQVQVDRVGADLVCISVLDAKFPTAILKGIAEQVGVGTGGGSRGIQISQSSVDPQKPGLAVWKVIFAVNGLVDPATGRLHLQPLVRAMAGIPSPDTISEFLVDFDYVKPGEDAISYFDSKAIHFDRRQVGRSIEYTVILHSQDPATIVVPDHAESTPTASAPLANQPVDPVVIVALALASVCSGALVYSLVLLRGSQKRRQNK